MRRYETGVKWSQGIAFDYPSSLHFRNMDSLYRVKGTCERPTTKMEDKLSNKVNMPRGFKNKTKMPFSIETTRK